MTILFVILSDECKTSNEMIVFLQTLVHFVIARATNSVDYSVFQFVPNLDFFQKNVWILLTILPRVSVLLIGIDGHQCLVDESVV